MAVGGLLVGALTWCGDAGAIAPSYSGAAHLVSPACGDLLPSVRPQFTWNDTQAAGYSLLIGDTKGAFNVYPGATSGPTLPAGTVTLTPDVDLDLHRQYWVRLRSLNPSTNKWDFSDCTVGPAYTGPAAISSPRCGGTFDSATPTIEWPEVNALQYSLWIGGTKGGKQWYPADLPGGSLILQGQPTQVTIPATNKLPTDGRALWVRLRSLNPSTNKWDVIDCQVNTVHPDFTSPTCGSTLTDTTETLQWSANGNPDALQWKVSAGTAIGGQQFGLHDWEDPRISLDLTGIPGDGSLVFTRLQWRKSEGAKVGFKDCKMLAPTFAPPPLTSPVCEGTLPGASTTFSWGPGDWDIANWGLQVGSTPGGSEYYNQPDLGNVLATPTPVTGLPTDGRLVYARLRFQPKAIERWLQHDCVLTAAGPTQPPVFTSPACGDALPGTKTTFTWDPRDSDGQVQAWQLRAGSSLGGAQYFDSGTLSGTVEVSGSTVTRTSADASGLPQDGRALFVRLYWRQNDTWRSSDCLFTAYKAQSLATEGTAERTSTRSCTTTPTSAGKPMPLANTIGCIKTPEVCEPPHPPLDPPVPGNLAFPRLAIGGTTGSKTGDPNAFGGIWSLTGGYASVCNDKRKDDLLSTGNFAVSQDDAGKLSGKITTIIVPNVIGCSYTCKAAGQCTFDCPDAQGLRCDVTCDPKTDYCDRDSTVSGQVTPEGKISLSITHHQTIDFKCGKFGTIHMDDSQGRLDDPTTTSTDESLPGLELEFDTPPARVVN